MGGRQAVFACFVVTLFFLSHLHSLIVQHPAATATELPQLAIRAEPKIAFAPGFIDVVVIAKPDARNRRIALAIGANDSGFERSSQWTLDGENEPGQLANVRYPDVPAGSYVVVAALFDREGKLLVRKAVDVRRMSRFR